MHDPVSDTELVDRARQGRLDAFSELVRRHYRGVYRVAYRILGKPGDAEDATQDAFERAWLAVRGFRGDAAFGTWMYRIVTNTALKTRRRRAREPASEEVAEAADWSEPPPDTVVERQLRDEAVRRAIAALPPEQRTPVVLREFADCSYEEIARILDITQSAVRGRLHRARLKLMEAMRPWT